MSGPRTTFAMGINPFERPKVKPVKPVKPTMTKPAPKQPKKEGVFTDPASLQITNDALPAQRTLPQHKYNPVFERMKYGQCVRCATGDVGKVSGAMRKFVETKGKQAQVRTVTRYPGDEGYGRVWMIDGGKSKAIDKIAKAFGGIKEI